jgi:hypothetical protein
VGVQLYSVTMVHWYKGTMVHWYNSTMLQLYTGMMVQGDSNKNGTGLCVNKPHCVAAV